GAPRRDDGPREPDRPRVRRVTIDPREEDVLRWAIHEPELVADWIDASLFVDPIARAAFEQLSGSAELHDALASSEGDVQVLLERLGVEEPVADAEPETVRARLVVNLAEPAAQRLLDQLLREGDERAIQVKLKLDAVRVEAANGWASGEANAMQLVRWITQ